MRTTRTKKKWAEDLNIHFFQRKYQIARRYILRCWTLLIIREMQITSCLLESVQSSSSVLSDTLWPHDLQHTRLPCPSPIPGAYSNSCSLSWWCHPTISSSVVPFFSCLQSFPASVSVFSNESVLCIKWPKYWSFSINPFNEYSGLISFRINKKARGKCWTGCWEKWILHAQLVEMQTCVATMENSIVAPQKLKIGLLRDPAISLLGIYLKKMETLIQKDVCSLMFIPALFMAAKVWNNLTVHKWMDG